MLDLNTPDKVLAGLNQSYTLKSDEGVPEGTVRVEGKELEHRVLTLGPPKELPTGTPLLKYKISFFIPDGTAGKKLEIELRAGGSTVSESLDIIEE